MKTKDLLKSLKNQNRSGVPLGFQPAGLRAGQGAFSRLFLAGQVTERQVSGTGAGIEARLHTWGRNHYNIPDIGIGGQISPVSKAGLRGSSYGLELNAERAKEEARSGAAATKKSRGKAAANPASKAKKTGGLFD